MTRAEWIKQELRDLWRRLHPDRIAKWLMPNLTVQRRYILGCWIVGVIAVGVMATLVDKVGDNTHRAELAICAVIKYQEEQSPAEEGAASARLRQLGNEMRATGVRCPPPSRRP